MKRIALISGIVALAGIVAFSGCKNQGNATAGIISGSDSTSVAKGGIVYVDIDRITEEYEMAKEITATMNAKTAGLEQDITRRGQKIERDMASFQQKMNQGALSQSVAEAQYKKLQDDQTAFQKYAAQKQAEVQDEGMKLQAQILNAISYYIKDWNEKKGYSMVLATTGKDLSVPVICADESMNVTDEIIEGLNKKYQEERDKPAKAAADTTAVK